MCERGKNKVAYRTQNTVIEAAVVQTCMTTARMPKVRDILVSNVRKGDMEHAVPAAATHGMYTGNTPYRSAKKLGIVRPSVLVKLMIASKYLVRFSDILSCSPANSCTENMGL